MRKVLFACGLLAVLFGLGSEAAAAQIEVRGKLELPAASRLLVVSTDPVVQQVLNDELRAAHRNAEGDTANAVALTVTCNQQLLKPGVSLGDLSPGDPEVASMLKAAGATPPPVGDTGTTPIDPYEAQARAAARNPADAMIQELQRAQNYAQGLGQFHNYGGQSPSPYDNLPGSDVYDTAIVAHAALSGSKDQFTIVAVAHPGENLRKIKKLVAERIANAVLH